MSWPLLTSSPLAARTLLIARPAVQNVRAHAAKNVHLRPLYDPE